MEWLSVKKSTGQLYLLPYRVQTGSGANPACYPMGIGCSYARG